MSSNAAASARPDQDLPSWVAEQLRQWIYAGELPPGQRLNEAALALRMGISRGPVREAIRMLAGQGLVTAVVNRGVFVREVSVREMLETYELRSVMFGFAAERAADHLTDADKQAFESLLAAMDEACEQNDAGRYYALNLDFHALLMRLSGNRRAEAAYDEYVKELHQFRRRYFNVPGNMRQSNVEHRQIYEAIAEGARTRARRAAEKHVLEGRERLLRSLDR